MTEPQTFRKKPVEIQAVQFLGDNRREVLSFIYPDMSEVGLRGAEVMRLPVVIGTLEGDMTVSPGDWVIRGVQGEFYPCKPDIFAATYEAADARGMAGHRLTVESGLSGCRGECSCGEWAHVARKAGPETVTRLWDAEHLTSLQLEQVDAGAAVAK